MDERHKAEKALTVQDIPQETMETVCFHALGLIDRNREYLQQHLQRGGSRDPAAMAALEDIAVASNRLGHVLTELMSLLDCVRGTQQPELRVLDLCALLDCIVREARPVLRAGGVTLRCRVPGEGGCHVLADRGYAEQICMRLLSNALRACGPSGEVELGLCRDGGQWQLTVLDNGCGLNEPQDLEQRRRFLGGARAGLLLCREYCRLMGWSLELQDRPEGGAQARVTLPALPDDLPPAQTVELCGADLYADPAQSDHVRKLVLQELRTVPSLETAPQREKD